MKRLLIIMSILVLCCASAGCAKQTDGGVIADKHIIPSHTENELKQQMIPAPDGRIKVMYIPSEKFVPEKYEIILNVRYSDGSVREKRKFVSKELYDSVSIGDSYDKTAGLSGE